MDTNEYREITVTGIDCADCAKHVKEAISGVEGVNSVEIFISSGKAAVSFNPHVTEFSKIKRAITEAGYSVPGASAKQGPSMEAFGRRILTLLAVVFGAVLFIVVIGEWLGLFEHLTKRVPLAFGVALVVASGFPIFRNVLRSAIRGRITSHTLMTLGVAAALAVGEWATAAVVVFFMRMGEYAEGFTMEGARRAVKDLTAMAPQSARVERLGEEVQLPIDQVKVGETVIVRPGEKIPVDGEVVSGQAVIDQASITGESVPVEAAPGSKVFAATIAQLGSLRVRAERIGADTTFGKVIKMVEGAEANRADVQRFADRFSGYYLPIIVGVAALTFFIRRDPLSTAAVLVVACSCSIALATPIAMLASIGASAKRGLLIKGGKYLEALAKADVVLIDKTGTLTLGKPRITDIIPLKGSDSSGILALAASAERYSEHPLAEAVRLAAKERALSVPPPDDFETIPGMGVIARVDNKKISVGNKRMLDESWPLPVLRELEEQGKTLLFITCDGEMVGVLAASDTMRPEVPDALAMLADLGVQHVELLTGDNERTALSLGNSLGVPYQANLLPEDKIRIVKEYQSQGHTVIMIGDGVNDAPALAQADVGIAMGAAGADVAIEAAHVALMRDDWMLIPELFRTARRAMSTVRLNLVFTAFYNVAGISLAALGFLPPILAAAAQSLPDLGILANSARLLRHR
jgi:P-type Cu+ transporter